MGIELLTLVTEGSITHTLEPVFVTVADAFFITPANSDVIWTMRNTENVSPMSKAANLPLSLTRSL